jgi:hypothetical protein
MYFQITKLINLLPLPEDAILHILHLAGYIRLRNGKYMPQINRLNPIYKYLRMIPRFRSSEVKLFIQTKWFRRSFCDQIITLKNVFYNDELKRVYDCSWYEYDECNAQHHLVYVDHYITYDIDFTIDALDESNYLLV